MLTQLKKPANWEAILKGKQQTLKSIRFAFLVAGIRNSKNVGAQVSCGKYS